MELQGPICCEARRCVATDSSSVCTPNYKTHKTRGRDHKEAMMGVVLMRWERVKRLTASNKNLIEKKIVIIYNS